MEVMCHTFDAIVCCVGFKPTGRTTGMYLCCHAIDEEGMGVLFEHAIDRMKTVEGKSVLFVVEQGKPGLFVSDESLLDEYANKLLRKDFDVPLLHKDVEKHGADVAVYLYGEDLAKAIDFVEFCMQK